VYASNREVTVGVKGGILSVDFLVGAAENPKLNALVLVEGGLENTHYDHFNQFMKEMEELANERRMQRQKEEQLFQN